MGRSLTRWLCVLGACSVGVTSISAQSTGAPPIFTETLARYSALTVGREAWTIQGLKLAAGHLTVALDAGTAAPVMAGDEVVGVFFSGTGTFELVSEDPVEFPAVSYNVKKNTNLKVEASEERLTIRGAVEELLWLPGSEAIPSLGEQRAPSSLPGRLAAHVKNFDQVFACRPLAQQEAAWKLDGGDKAMVRAQISGNGLDLVYVFDAFDARSESLSAALKRPTLDNRIYPAVLTEQPLGHGRRQTAPPRVLLVDVDLQVDASADKDVSIVATERFVAVGAPVRVLLLDLYDTRYGRSVFDVRHLRVKRIVDETGASLPFDHRRDQLAVGLAAPLLPGKQATLRFEIEGDILYNPDGDSYWELGVGPWYPRPPLAGQYHTAHTTVRVAKPFIPFAPGATVRRESEGEWNLVETRLEKPVRFIAVLAGKYEYEEATSNGVTVRVASYAGMREAGIRRLATLAQKILEYYEGFLGPFPFPELNIIEINAWGFGQAPPATMFITSEAFNPLGGETNKIFSQGVNERFAHEIAHQYWGQAVKWPSWEEQWLSEAFAEMCAGLLIRDLRGKGEFNSMQTGWRTLAKEVTATAPIPMANRLDNTSDYAMASMYRTYLLYAKGPWLLNAIRKDIGDDRFLVFLRSCQSNLAWKFGSTEMVQTVLEAVTKKSWKSFFDSYYWGTAMPEK